MSRLQRSMEGARGRGPCGKAKYLSRGAARRGRLKMIENGSGDPGNDWRLGEYYCCDCEAYHVGHDSSVHDWETWADRCLANAATS